MTRPITKEPPKGSRLATYTDRIVADYESAKPFWQYDDPAIRAVGVNDLLRNEQRMWCLPREIVRDELVLPAIAKIEGQEAADAMRRMLPSVLDDFVDLICEDAKRRATARERRAPERKIAWAVKMVVMAALFDNYDRSATANANHKRAARRLGVSRFHVRRIDQEFRRRLGALGEVDRQAAIAAIWATIKMLAEYDRQIGKRTTVVRSRA